MKIDKTMKRWIFILIAALAIFLTADLCARERGVKFSGGTDLVSTYVWRGVRESGPAFQPSLTMSAGNFSATAWGSVDFDSAYKEMDLTLAYALGPVTLSVADLYWTGHADDRYFVFDSRSPHRIEVGASWVVSEKVPVTLSWYTVLFGATDVNHKGERAYASYFEAACPFTVKTVDMKAGVGMVPWNAAATYLTGDRGFCVQNVFLNAGKSWTIKGTDSMSVGVFTNLIWNPALDDVNFVGGISFRRSPMERQDSVQRFLELIRRSHRGKFKVYIGMSAGVGKTCRMLQEARQLLDAGVDVRIGYIETHGRAGTEALVEGLPLVPRRRLFYKGKELEEMDTQAIVNLRPEIVVVDELAHTNIEGSENPKRWQDVMQILDAGISVISAVNIQHIEGLNEVVEEITGIEIRERVPDSVLAMADEVVNIDLTADELIERLKAGKIYRPDKIAAALGNFFTQDNLLQLRELALKEVALRVEKKVDSEVTGSETFRRDKLLAVIDSSEKRARRVIRKTARMATHLNAAFTVLYVQGDREADDRIPLARQRHLINNLNLATELGGEVRRIRSNSPVESIAGVCREQKINIVCIGRPEFSLFSLLKSAIRLRRLTVRLSRMNIDLFIFS